MKHYRNISGMNVSIARKARKPGEIIVAFREDIEKQCEGLVPKYLEVVSSKEVNEIKVKEEKAKVIPPPQPRVVIKDGQVVPAIKPDPEPEAPKVDPDPEPTPEPEAPQAEPETDEFGPLAGTDEWKALSREDRKTISAKRRAVK